MRRKRSPITPGPFIFGRLLFIVCTISWGLGLYSQEPKFVDVTGRSGIEFIHRCGSREKNKIVEVNGSGVALFDCDQDGDLDVYFVNAGEGGEKGAGVARAVNALYRNEGGWKFTDITASSRTGDPGWGRECRKDKENGILKIGKWYMKSGVGLILVASSSTVILIAMKRGNSSKACSLVMRYSSEMFEAAALTSSAKSSGTSTR